MPYLQINEQQYPLSVGDVSVGTGGGARIRLPGPEALGVQAFVTVTPTSQALIRRSAATAVVRVNGVQLGAEPAPLLHGDKIEVAGQELLYGDERKGGGTQYISPLAIPDVLGTPQSSAPARPTAATGGRLISLVDGREYLVGDAGVVIGRDAGCDVVVPSSEVSRRHARIVPGARGYEVSDTSTNGVFVNGQRVSGSQLLGRGDILRVGNEEFRFYADVPAPEPAAAGSAVAPPSPAAAAAGGAGPPAGSPGTPAGAAAPAAAAATPAAPASSGPLAAAAGAPGVPAAAAGRPAAAQSPEARDAARAPAAPAPPAAPAAPASARPALATLEVINEGIMKGRRYEIRQPLAHVGRGAHNDVVLADESVSESHAKLQRRESGWVLVDMGSTNGTYVSGRRVAAEQALAGATEVRFGGVKMRFEPAAEALGEVRPTRAIAGVSAEQARRLSAQTRQRDEAAAERVEAESEEPRSLPGWLWIVALALLLAAGFFIFQGR